MQPEELIDLFELSLECSESEQSTKNYVNKLVAHNQCSCEASNETGPDATASLCPLQKFGILPIDSHDECKGHDVEDVDDSQAGNKNSKYEIHTDSKGI